MKKQPPTCRVPQCGTPNSLEQKTRRITELLVSMRDGSFEIAELILEAHDDEFGGRGLDWLNWSDSQFGFSRRHTFRLLKVGAFIRRCRSGGIDLSAVYGTNIENIEIIADLNPDQVMAFVSAHDVRNMDREELRDAVAKFIGKTRANHPDQLDFFASLRLPAPEKFNAMLTNNLSKVDAAEAADYGSALINASLTKGGMTDEERKNLESNLWHFLKLSTGRDFRAVFRHINLG